MAKIAVYKGEIVPMHYHPPYQYWQFAWESHRHSSGDHYSQHIDAPNPRWVGPESTASVVVSYKPSEQEVAWYNECLVKKTRPPIDPETAYNMLKILGKLEGISGIQRWLREPITLRSRNGYATITNAARRVDTDVLTLLLGAEYANTKHL